MLHNHCLNQNLCGSPLGGGFQSSYQYRLANCGSHSLSGAVLVERHLSGGSILLITSAKLLWHVSWGAPLFQLSRPLTSLFLMCCSLTWCHLIESILWISPGSAVQRDSLTPSKGGDHKKAGKVENLCRDQPYKKYG